MVIGAVLAAAFVFASAPVPPDPVEGLWGYGGGLVAVVQNGAGFNATVVKPIAFSSSCPHPGGEQMWKLSATGDVNSYRGTHRFLTPQVCKSGGLGRATWKIDDTNPNILHFCATDPDGAGDPRCVDLTRVPAGPLAGSWVYSGGVVRVVGSEPRLVGTVVQRTKLSVCAHPAGEVIWETAGSLGVFTGTNLGFAGRSCTRRQKHRAVFVVAGDTLYTRIARRVNRDPGSCGAETDCVTLRRAGA